MRRGQAFSLLPTSRADSTTIPPNFEMYHVSDLGFDASCAPKALLGPGHGQPTWPPFLI